MRKFKCLRNTKKCQTSLAIREMQIETHLRFHLILFRIVKSNNTNDNSWWRGCGAKGTFIHYWWEWKTFTVTMEIIVFILGEDENWSTSRSNYTTFWHKPKQCFILAQRHLLEQFLCHSIHTIQKLKVIYIFVNRRMNKNCGIFTQCSLAQQLKTWNS